MNATDISRIERGKLIPSAGQVDKLAAALNIAADELLKPVALEHIIAAGKTALRLDSSERGR